MKICGIDPGLSGAIAFYDTATGAVETHPIPVLVLKRRTIDPHGVAALLVGKPIDHAFVEKQWPRPNDGKTQAAVTAEGYGIIQGILAAGGVPFTIVAPQTWKKALAVPAAKDGARARASQLLPDAADQWQQVKEDGKAEASLIAYYGACCRTAAVSLHNEEHTE